jgi:basic amino acid/polyamine antiporter, APA family
MVARTLPSIYVLRVNPTNNEASLVRALGVWGLAANIVNVTIGGGIFRLPAAAADALGPAAPLAFIVCAIAMALIVLCFAEAGSRVSLTGGVYAYVEVAFGPFVGFLTGVMMWAGITVAMSAVSSFFGDSLVALVPALAPYRTATIVVVLAALGMLNVAGVRGANRFNTVMTVAKILPLLLLIVVGLSAMHGANLKWTSTPDIPHLSRASVVVIFAFLGVETALVPGAEVDNPSRTVPRAIFIAMAAVTVLYLVVQLVTQGILGAALPGQKTPLAEAAAVAMGPAGRTLILAGMAISMFGYVSGMTLAVPRSLYAFARDGFLPSPIAAVHERFRTPHVAIVIQTLVVILLATTGTFESLAVIANGSILLVYAACCVAVVQLRRLGIQQTGTPFRVPFAAAIPVVAFLIIAWILAGLSANEWRWLFVIVGVGAVIFAASMSTRRARAGAPA